MQDGSASAALQRAVLMGAESLQDGTVGLLCLNVFPGYYHVGIGSFPVASCAAGFLKILLICCRNPVMYDSPYVVLVYSHSERTGGYKYPVMRAHEPFLQFLPFCSGQSGMVVTYGDAACLHHQPDTEHACVIPRTAEHDGRTAADAGNLDHGLGPAQRGPGAVDDVGPVYVAAYHQRFCEEQAGPDVPYGLLCGSGGESQDLVRPEPGDGIRERKIGGSEISSPLGYHMGLVHHQQADAVLRQPVQCRPVLKTLRGGEHYLCSRIQPAEYLRTLVPGLAATDADAVDPGFPKL